MWKFSSFLLLILLSAQVFSQVSKAEVEQERERRKQVIEQREQAKQNPGYSKLANQKPESKEQLLEDKSQEQKIVFEPFTTKKVSAEHKAEKPNLTKPKVSTYSEKVSSTSEVEAKIQQVRKLDNDLGGNYNAAKQAQRNLLLTDVLQTSETTFKSLNQEYQEMILELAKERGDDVAGKFFVWFKEDYKK